MSSPPQHAHGSPCWFELSTSDQAAAKAFYSTVFGWQASDSPLPDGSYTIWSLDGREVAAGQALMAEQAAQGVPPHWAVYFRVDDADATAAQVRAGGGQVLVEPFDVMQHVRMAVCSDPEGAVFCLSQPILHPGVGAIREDDAICWVELAMRDLDAADAFYKNLFGWDTADYPNSPTRYRTYANGDGMLGGLLAMTPEWGEMPSHWSIYIQVADVDATVAKAEAAGGKLCFPAFDAPGVGRIARINDPAGAGFYVIRLDSQAA